MKYMAMARQRSALANCDVVSLVRPRSACRLVSIAMAASLPTCSEVMIRLVCPACSVVLPTSLSSSGREVIALLRNAGVAYARSGDMKAALGVVADSSPLRIVSM